MNVFRAWLKELHKNSRLMSSVYFQQAWSFAPTMASSVVPVSFIIDVDASAITGIGSWRKVFVRLLKLAQFHLQ